MKPPDAAVDVDRDIRAAAGRSRSRASLICATGS